MSENATNTHLSMRELREIARKSAENREKNRQNGEDNVIEEYPTVGNRGVDHDTLNRWAPPAPVEETKEDKMRARDIAARQKEQEKK